MGIEGSAPVDSDLCASIGISPIFRNQVSVISFLCVHTFWMERLVTLTESGKRRV